MTDRVKQMTTVQNEALELFTKKNADYGDSFATFGPIGIIVRMQDKINRLVSVSNKSISFVNDETLRDTLIDLHNYSAMVVMLLDEKCIKETNEIGKHRLPEQDSMDALRENGFLAVKDSTYE